MAAVGDVAGNAGIREEGLVGGTGAKSIAEDEGTLAAGAGGEGGAEVAEREGAVEEDSCGEALGGDGGDDKDGGGI